MNRGINRVTLTWVNRWGHVQAARRVAGALQLRQGNAQRILWSVQTRTVLCKLDHSPGEARANIKGS